MKRSTAGSRFTRLALIALVLAVAVLGSPQMTDWTQGLLQGEATVGVGPRGADADPVANPMIRDVRIRDLDGRLAYRGDIDLGPVLARIQRGERDEHPNDGSEFRNREGLLPSQGRGYYREYVVRTPGIRHAGPQRLVLGSGGEVFYTPDHYRSFVRVR